MNRKELQELIDKLFHTEVVEIPLHKITPYREDKTYYLGQIVTVGNKAYLYYTLEKEGEEGIEYLKSHWKEVETL
jgi:hypothetical protein